MEIVNEYPITNGPTREQIMRAIEDEATLSFALSIDGVLEVWECRILRIERSPLIPEKGWTRIRVKAVKGRAYDFEYYSESQQGHVFMRERRKTIKRKTPVPV